MSCQLTNVGYHSLVEYQNNSVTFRVVFRGNACFEYVAIKTASNSLQAGAAGFTRFFWVVILRVTTRVHFNHSIVILQYNEGLTKAGS